MPKLKPSWFPDYQAYYRKRFVELIRRKAYAARPLHGNVEINRKPIGPLFDRPDELVNLLAKSDLIDVEHPRSSQLFEAMSFSGPMYKIFTKDEETIILDWIESLQKPAGPQQPSPANAQEAAKKVLSIIDDNKKRAMRAARHGQERVAGRSLKDWFSEPAGLMEALAGSREWVMPGDSSNSKLYQVFDQGDMEFLGVAEEIKQWIDTGAELVGASEIPADEEIPLAAAPLRQHRGAYVPPSEAVAAAPVAVAPEVRKARRDFAAKRKLIGMGAVH